MTYTVLSPFDATSFQPLAIELAYVPMQILQAAVLYFLLVFGAGFVLGTGRVLFLVPLLGENSRTVGNAADLETIYAHFDSSTTITAMPPGFANANVHTQENWGEKVSDNGKTALFVRDFGNYLKIFTFVIWATE